MFNWEEFIVKNKIKSFLYRIFVRSWEIKYPLLISIISVCFTGAGWYAQHKVADNYEKNTRQVIINSTELANFQLDMLLSLIHILKYKSYIFYTYLLCTKQKS